MPASTQRAWAVLPPALALVLMLSLGTTWTRDASASLGGVPPRQELALLWAPHTARSSPSPGALALQRVGVRRPLTAERTELPVLGKRRGARGATWLDVLLPGRPNGHSGWIEARKTTRAVTIWRLVVDLSRRQVIVYRRGRIVRTFEAIVGKPSTPTPVGDFFVEEAIALRPGEVGAPFALALSARSTVLQEFAGGPGQIAVHGLANIGGVLGTAVSHGCVRLSGRAMRWLVVRIGSGVPVTVRR